MTATECVPPEYVILVDEHDNEIGTAEKLIAHQNNWLHRAFSIFIFRQTAGLELLLQQRALHKYHSPGLWTNTCCSHPRPGEDILAAANRRLQEELGMQAELKNLGWFKYNAHFSNGLAEHEIDHVLVGEMPADGIIQPNPEEVHAIRWVTIETLEKELSANPEKFTPWLKSALKIALKSLL